MTFIQLFESRKETAIVLDFVEKTFHQVSLLVKMAIKVSLFFAVFAGWYHRFRLFFCNLLQELIRVIRAICYHTLKCKISNQIIGLSNVMSLPTRQEKSQWIPQAIYTRMDLGAEPASAAPKGLGFLAATFFRAPAAHGCARTTVLSNKILSMSGSLAKC